MAAVASPGRLSGRSTPAEKRTLDDVTDEIGFGWGVHGVFALVNGGAIFFAGAVNLLVPIVVVALAREESYPAGQRGWLASVFFAGQLAGNLAAGGADSFGRRTMFTAGLSVSLVAWCASTWSAAFAIQTAWRAALGLGFGLSTPAANALLVELTPTRYRLRYSGLLGMGAFCLGMFFAIHRVHQHDPELSSVDWRALTWSVAGPGALALLLALRYLRESPRFLAVVGRRDEAVSELKELRRANGVASVDVERWVLLEADASNVSELFFAYRYTTCTMCLACFVLNYAYYGGIYALPQLLPSLDLGTVPPTGHLAIGTAAELVGAFVFIAFGERLTRRTFLLSYVGLLGVLTMLFAVLLPDLPGSADAGASDAVAGAIAALSIYGQRFAIAMGWVAVYLYLVEVYPTRIRATGSAFAIAVGRGGSILAPLAYEAAPTAFWWSIVVLCFANAVATTGLPVSTEDRGLGDIGAFLVRLRNPQFLGPSIVSADGSEEDEPPPPPLPAFVRGHSLQSEKSNDPGDARDWNSLRGWGLTHELFRLWLGAAVQMCADWTRPLVFMTFFSRNLTASNITPAEKPMAEDAVALAVTSLNLVVFATAYGFNFAVDSYASLAYGAQDRTDLWAVLLRQCVLLCGLGVVCFALLLMAEQFFLALGIEDEMARSSGHLLLLLGWAVPGDFLYDALARWLRAQQLHQYVAVCSVTALAVNLALNFSLASPEHPTRGPLIALVAQNTVLPVLLMAAYWYSQPAALKEIAKVWPRLRIFGPALWSQLATSTAAMLWACAELWAWEVQVFAAAHLGAGKAAAYVLLSATYSLLIQTFPAGIALAAGALVGEAYGCGKKRWAQRIFDHACTLALIFVVAYTAVVWSTRDSLASFLSGGVPEVEAAYARALPLVLAMHYLDGLFVVAKVNLTIRKEQVFGAAMTLVIYYALCLPLSFWLAFTQGWDIVGLWAGLSLAVLLGVMATGAKILLEPADDEGTKSESDDSSQPGREEENCLRSPRGQWFATLLVPGILALTAFYVRDEPWHERRPLSLIQRVVCHGSPLADHSGCPLTDYRLPGSYWAED